MPLLWIVGKVVSPTSTVFPVTAIDTGELSLEIPASLPHENLPTGLLEFDVVATPTIEVPGSI
jgi:hypothetical protein